MKEYILKKCEDGRIITVRDVQMVLLEMLKDLDQLCKRHSIPYYLVGGSALGAVRHQGFIPWDDDADIAMLREDYERFLIVLKKHCPEDYYYQCFDTHPEYNVLIPAMKFRKKNTYVKEVNTLLANKCKDGDGLFIDVFIVDYVAENKTIDLMNRLASTAMMPLITMAENLHLNPLRLKKAFVNHAIHYGKRHRHSPLIGYDLTWTFNSPLKPICYPFNSVYPVKYVAFEDTFLPIPNNPEMMLNVEIGLTHMQYPSEKHQQPKHIVDIEI